MAEATKRETLADTGLETMKLFTQVNSIDDFIGSPGHKAWPKARFAAEADRFELWAVNLGLFVSGHGSLDYRVRQAESIQHTLQRFMIGLNNSLIEVLEYSAPKCDQSTTKAREDPPGNSLNIESWDDDAHSDIDLLLDGVKDPIDRLYKVSTWIRNPSSRFASSKALRHQQIDPESKVDLLQVVEKFDYDYVSSLFLQYRKSRAREEYPTVSPPENSDSDDPDNVWEPIRTVLSQQKVDLLKGTESFLVRRIARANVRRRQQFSYWKKHREKLSQQSKTVKQHIEVRNEMTPIQLNLGIQANETSTPMMAPAQSVTTASRLNIPQLPVMDDQSNISVSEYAPSACQPSKEIVDFPPPPKRSLNGKFFECPYCFTLCSKALLTEKAWKAHLIHDLRPYICTYENCKNSDQLYDTRQDWIQHEDSSHRTVLRCPEHPDKTFSKLEGYQEHLRDEHVSYSDEVSAIFISHASISTLALPDRCCPICSLSLSTVTELQAHIALHLERLSLFSLPRSVGEDDNDVNEAGSDRANVNFDGSRDEDFDEDLDFIEEGDIRSNPFSASNLEWQGKYYEAEAMHRRALANREIELGVKRPDTLPDTKTGSELHTLKGHLDLVYSVAFSPDGQIIASGSSDETIKLWDVKTGSELYTLEGHSGLVYSVAFSPNSQIIASGSSDKTIKLWDVKTGSELYTLESHSGLINSVAFSPNSQIIASGSNDKTIKLWDVKTSSELYTLEGHSDWVFSVAFSPDNQIIASGSNDRTIKLWDVKTSSELYTLKGHSDLVFSVAFSPNDQIIASGSPDKTIKLWDVKTGSELYTLEGHSDLINSVAFSPNGQTIASGGDETIKLWDVKTGSELYTLEGHSGWVCSVAFSPDGQTIASGGGKTIKLWDAKAGFP